MCKKATIFPYCTNRVLSHPKTELLQSLLSDIMELYVNINLYCIYCQLTSARILSSPVLPSWETEI